MSLSKIKRTYILEADVIDVLESCEKLLFVQSREQLMNYVLGGSKQNKLDVEFKISKKETYKELEVVRCKNGMSVNFYDVYMRRRDPNAMLIADDLPSNKKRYAEMYSKDFKKTRKETFAWLKKQQLFVLPFFAGPKDYGYLSLALVPKAAAFFALAVADLQGFVPISELSEEQIHPRGIIYVAPPFRHTHFKGKQVVVHNRKEKVHEVFSYNLYPGPSAKKGVYSMLLNIGEMDSKKWTTLHCSTVKVITPYECEVVIMHEGASGGGKTEMTQEAHTKNGQLVLARNPSNSDEVVLDMRDTSRLFPLTDDMGSVHPDKQKNKKLVVEDAEDAWFLRVDHLKQYGTDPILEGLSIDPPKPLVFLNIDGKVGSTALLWEHTMDDAKTPCPNPRVIVPRENIHNIVDGPLEVDIRSFGVRTPRATKSKPSYGIIGMLHVLPPALAWLWRLVAPRGDSNPSIISTGKGLTSEGVGSYWPFAVGTRVEQANILLDQIQRTPETKYVLIPNQYIGAFHVGFSAQWTSREILARRGGVNFKENQLIDSRCSLLGYSPLRLSFSGVPLSQGLLRVEEQLEVGVRAYDIGSKQIVNFFKQELQLYLNDENLSPLGRKIIGLCMKNAKVRAYKELSKKFFESS